MKIFFIVACTKDGGIGKAGGLPWPHMKEDMRNFTQLTKGEGKAVVMGRKTWESLPERHKPLAGRINLVVSSTLEDPRCIVVKSVSEAVQTCLMKDINELWFIGGQRIYNDLFELDIGVDRGYVTIFSHEDKGCDTHFNLSRLYSRYHEEHMTGPFEQGGYSYVIKEYVKS